MAPNPNSQIADQYSIIKSFFLHIIPGLATTAAFIILKPLLASGGYPPLLAFLLAVLLVDLPLLAGIMLREGMKINGRYTLDGVVLYREKVSWKTFTLVFIGAFAAVFLLITLAAPITNILTETVFAGLPDWFFLEEQTQYGAYTRNILILVFAFQLVLTGIALPWLEELYFRGFLLPRISRFGAWTPIIGGLLFGLYHTWQLFGFLTVFLLGAALSFVAMRTRDIRLPISLHVFANALTRLMFLMAAIEM